MQEKVVIFSCATGEGHNSCSKAIAEEFLSHGVPCDVVDGLSFISDGTAEFVGKVHAYVYKNFPELFGTGYNYTGKHPSAVGGDKSVIYQFLSLGAKRMYYFFVENGYTAIICPHPLLHLMIGEMYKRYPVTAPSFLVATDYTCSSGTNLSKLDYCFIPDESLKDEFISGNITEDKIIVSGIPVKKQCYTHMDKSEAKKSVGVGANNRHLLVACGSMGCGPIKAVACKIADCLTEGQEMSIVCGNNKSLLMNLSEKFADNPRVHPLGYVDYMPRLMSSADLFLTKPGGLSSTEAAVKGLPMVFVNAVPGVEPHNMEFFKRLGGGMSMENDDEDALSALCVELLKNKERTDKMSAALKERFKDNAAEIIYSFVMQKLEEKNASASLASIEKLSEATADNKVDNTVEVKNAEALADNKAAETDNKPENK